jgi:hypothetical protein
LEQLIQICICGLNNDDSLAALAVVGRFACSPMTALSLSLSLLVGIAARQFMSLPLELDCQNKVLMLPVNLAIFLGGDMTS